LEEGMGLTPQVGGQKEKEKERGGIGKGREMEGGERERTTHLPPWPNLLDPPLFYLLGLPMIYMYLEILVPVSSYCISQYFT